MKLELKVYDCFCATKVFRINGIEARYEDFGDKQDIDWMNAPDYCCANMQFIPCKPTEEILNKYGITVDEYTEVCNKLKDGLSFGSCGWCE